MQFVDAARTFMLIKQSEGLTEKTLSWYSGLLKQFGNWLGPRDIAEVSSLDVAEWFALIRQRKIASITVEGYYRGLMAFFNWCERSTHVGKPPSPIGHGPDRAIKRPKVDEPDFDYASHEEFTALVAAIDLANWIDYRDWCLIQIMFWCGVRREELLNMNVRDINFEKKEIRIRKTKARKQRSIFLLDDVVAGLLKYLEIRPAWSGPELWLGWHNRKRKTIGGRLRESGLRSMLVRRCKRAGIRYCNANLFRHGFGMEMLMADADIKAVSQLMGHANVRTTEMNYVKHLDRSLRKVHRRVTKRIADGYNGEEVEG